MARIEWGSKEHICRIIEMEKGYYRLVDADEADWYDEEQRVEELNCTESEEADDETL